MEHYMTLSAGIEELGIYNIKPFNLAIGTTDGEATFFLNSENSTMNTLLDTHEQTSYKQKVNVNTLLTFINSNEIKKIDFCKIDIEGSEMNIVPEPSFKVALDYISNIYIEAHDFPGNGMRLKENADIIQDVLNKCGFKTTRIMIDGILGEK